MFFKKSKNRKNTLKSISKMNRTLKTHFSYLFCMEEIDLLKLIPKNAEAVNSIRLEHLTQVFGLWYKGIVEEFYFYNKNIKEKTKITPLFNNFMSCFLHELYSLKILKNDLLKIDYSIDKEIFKIKFNEYDYQTKREKISDIDSMINVLDSFKIRLKKHTYPHYKEEILNKYLSIEYYGPMDIYKGYKNILKNIKLYNFDIKENPFNKTVHYLFSFRYDNLYKDYLRSSKNSKKDYRYKQIDIEKKRLEIEKNRIENEDKRYDFYFDYFLYRLMYDLEYVYLKKLGGVRKIADLIDIYLSNTKTSKAIEQNPIEIDVDRMLIIDKNDNKSSGGGKGKKIPLDVKDFDLIERDLIVRREQKAQENKKEIEKIQEMNNNYKG